MASHCRSHLCVAFFVTIFAAQISTRAEFKRINHPNPEDPMAVQIYELRNGLKVYLTENHETPRFEAQIAVRAGSKNDPPESTGLAHYLEHMLFKGTTRIGTLDYEKEKPHLDRILALYEQHFQETDPEKRKAIYAEINRESQAAAPYEIPNEMDKLYKAMGEEGLNAHTYHEETVYQINLPANRVEQWAMIESERFQHPVFRLFQPELEIVYEEKNRTLDNKEAIIEFAVNKVLFKKHPYGQQTTIGEVEHLKNPSLKNMYDYYHRHYVPGNMAIVISGDIESRRTMRLIDKYFSAWEPKPVPPQKSWTEEPLHGAERVTAKYKGEEYVMLGFRLPGRNHPDTDALKLVDMILDNATAGLINLNLNQQQRVRRAGSSPELNNDYGAEYLWGIPKKGQSLKEVEDLLLEQIELVRQGKFDDWILPAIVTDYKKSRKAQLESDAARVALMRNAFLAYQEWDRVVGEIGRIEKVSKQDVVRVANQYLGGGYVAGYRVDEQHDVPKIEKPQIEKIDIDAARQSEFFKRVASMKVKEIAPRFVKPGRDYRKLDAGEGVKLYYVKNPLNDLFALTLSVDLGTRHDNRLGAATLLLDKSGTTRLSAEALKKQWYKLGTDFSIAAAENETTISIVGLDENFAASFGLLTELLREPTASPETLAELKKIILVQREDTKKDFRAIAGALAQYNRYGTDSPFLRALPNDKLAALSMDDLHGLIKSLLTYRHAISYTGSLPLEKIQAVLAEHQVGSAPLKAPPPYKFLKLHAPAQSRTLVFNKEMAQSQVRIEFGDGEYNETDVPVVQLYNDYFSGGMSGIVFQELREARALAYSVFAHYANGGRRGEQNIMVGAIGCQADKTVEAVQGLADLFENLPSSKERFAETMESVVSHYRTDKLGFREITGTVRAWEKLELPVDPRKLRFEKIQRLGLADVMRFQQDHLKGRAKLISILGDKTKFNLEPLKKQGDVTEVESKDIFAY